MFLAMKRFLEAFMAFPDLMRLQAGGTDVQLGSSLRGIFGESATWDPVRKGVWWVDMHGHAITFTRDNGSSRLWKTPGPDLPWARALVLHETGGLIVALSDKLAFFDPDTGQFKPLEIDLHLPKGHLFNDAIVDPAGRLIIGTMLPGRGNDGKAHFYSIDHDLSVSVLVEGLNTTNGLGFSPDGKTLYYSDSFVEVRKIWSASYHPSTGRIGHPKLFVDFQDLPGKPDGAAIDENGFYWSAAMSSPWLHRFTPDGRLDQSVALPVDTPTKPAFGGPDFKTLFVTTGGLKNGEIDDGVKGGLLRLAAPCAGLVGIEARLKV
jgi:L-arabinonolactonase